MSVNESNVSSRHADVVVRKAENGWVVGNENVSDLTSAMVLADLFAADQADNDNTTIMQAVDENGAPRRPARVDNQGRPTPPPPLPPPTAPTPPPPRVTESGPQPRIGAIKDTVHGAGIKDRAGGGADEAARLAVTVAQLEHALASRVRVEQAIGVLAERHRLRPREAFDLLRRASRARGTRVTDLAQDVVASTANPLLLLPEELSRQVPEARPRTRSLRRGPGRHER
jgi:hypothetical protein